MHSTGAGPDTTGQWQATTFLTISEFSTNSEVLDLSKVQAWDARAGNLPHLQPGEGIIVMIEGHDPKVRKVKILPNE